MNPEPNAGRGTDTLKVPGDRQDRDAETNAQPDADADRATPVKDVTPGQPAGERRSPPLAIKEIEDIEDDAPGG